MNAAARLSAALADRYRIDLDDQRFLMVSSAGSNIDELVLVLNLGSALRAHSRRRSP
jgi:hypothetical protein